MKWSHSLLVGVMVMFALALAVRAEDANPAETLKTKGLTKIGLVYALPFDAELQEGMKAIRAAKKKVDDETKTRLALEKEINMAKNALANFEYESRQLHEEYAGTNDGAVGQRNRLVAEIKVVESKMTEVKRYKDDRDAKIRAMGEDARQNYITLVLSWAEKLEKGMAEYETVAADAEVKAAIEALNKPGKPKSTLGPTVAAKDVVAQIKKFRGDIMSATIPVKMDNNVPTVEVTINGKVTRTMILDSGAGIVSLPADFAEALDLKPGPKDEVMKLSLADGKIVEARKMMLKSVRVGQFTVENVECAVLPKTLVAAQPLLGNTFLGHFTYKLDREKSELHMAQIGGKPATPIKPDPKDPAKKPDVPAANTKKPATDADKAPAKKPDAE